MNWLIKIFISKKTLRLFLVAAILVLAAISAYGIAVWKIRKT